MENTTYTLNGISKLLEIDESTVKKWCLVLENNGYKFLKTENKKRLYVERDIIVLRYLRELVKTENMPLDTATAVLSSKITSNMFSLTPTNLHGNEEKNSSPLRSNEAIKQLLKNIEKQNDFSITFIERKLR